MRRLALSALFLVSCTGCATITTALFVPPQHHRDHAVRILWVHDSVMAQMQEAAGDSVEAMFQVVQTKVGQVCPADVERVGSCRFSTPADSGYLIVAIVRCPTIVATTFQVRADCPNPNAPTIHIHPHTGSGFGDTGNNCSPSPPDYAYQLAYRHLFDAIICGTNTRPTAFWFWTNPLLGTTDYPDTLTPYQGTVGPV